MLGRVFGGPPEVSGKHISVEASQNQLYLTRGGAEVRREAPRPERASAPAEGPGAVPRRKPRVR